MKLAKPNYTSQPQKTTPLVIQPWIFPTALHREWQTLVWVKKRFVYGSSAGLHKRQTTKSWIWQICTYEVSWWSANRKIKFCPSSPSIPTGCQSHDQAGLLALLLCFCQWKLELSTTQLLSGSFVGLVQIFYRVQYSVGICLLLCSWKFVNVAFLNSERGETIAKEGESSC